MIIYEKQGGAAITHTWLTFPDGQRHVTLGKSAGVNVAIETAIKSASDLLDVLLVKDVLIRRGHLVHLDIRYLLGARMDRPIDENQPATLFVICNVLNTAGFSSIRVLDPHSNASTAWMNAETVRPSGVLSRIFGNHYSSQWKDVAIVAPDAGARSRTTELLELANLSVLPVVHGVKRRDSQTGNLTDFQIENPKRVRPVCLIVDDLCDGGRTFSGLAAKLKEAGARQVDLFVTHGIFSQGLPLKDIDTVFCTNSFQSVDTIKGALVYNVQMREMPMSRETPPTKLPLEICDGHDVGQKPLSCINCARALGRKEGEERASKRSDPPASPDVGRLIESVRTHADDVRQALPLTAADLDAAADALASPDVAHFHSDQCYAVGPGDTEVLICGFGGHAKAETGPMRDTESASGVQVLASSGPPKLASPDVGRLIERLRKESALAFQGDIESWKQLSTLLSLAADALTALQARETELRDSIAGLEISQEAFSKSLSTARHLLALEKQERATDAALAQQSLEQAEADAASLRREVERLKTEQTRADIYGEVVAKWRPIVQEVEALRQAQARLGEKWREQADNEYNNRNREYAAALDACAGELEAIASVDPPPEQEGQ